MKNLILITGYLASGKSTLASSLRDEYNIFTLCKDNIKELLCDDIDFSSREENKRLSLASIDMMEYIFKNFIKIYDTMILEANFREYEIKKFVNYCKQNDIGLKVINLIGDAELLYSRFIARLVNRHKAHTSIHLEMGLIKFKEYLKELDIKEENAHIHNIDMTDLNEKDVLTYCLNILKDKNII